MSTDRPMLELTVCPMGSVHTYTHVVLRAEHLYDPGGLDLAYTTETLVLYCTACGHRLVYEGKGGVVWRPSMS